MSSPELHFVDANEAVVDEVQHHGRASRIAPSADALPQLFSWLMASAMKPLTIWSVGPPTSAGVM